jgi:predicted dehydrogenase
VTAGRAETAGGAEGGGRGEGGERGEGGDPVRLGVVGLGWWGRTLAAATARSGAAEVVACFARTEATRRRFAEEVGCRPASSLAELLAADDVEGVLLATPHRDHADQIEAAAASGCHVLVEKPLTLTTAEAHRAVAAAEAAGVVLMVGHQRRRQAANRRIRQLLDEGAIGRPLLAESTFTVAGGYPDTWRADRAETPLGAMTALGVHMVDTFLYLLGPIERVAAFSNAVIDDEPLDHATGLLLEFASGAVGTLLCSHFTPAANRLAVLGTAGAAYAEDDGARLLVQDRRAPARRAVDVEVNDPLAEQVAEFAGAIRRGTAVETGGREGLAVVAVLEAATASAHRGTAVALADLAPDRP